MRVGVISTPIFQLGLSGLSGYGGLEQIAWEQAKGLAAKGHSVRLFAPDGSQCPGAEVMPIGPAGQCDEKMAFGGFREAKQGDRIVRRAHAGYWQSLLDCDVVLDHTWAKHSYMLKAEGRLKAPVLGWMHAPVQTMYQTLPPVGKPCIVCISKDQRSEFEAFHGKPARTCYNGINLDLHKPLGIPRTKRFLFLARFSTVKGPDLAIEACKKAGVGLDLVGDTKLTGEAEYLQSILHMADGGQVQFVGPATRGETAYWYSQAHCMVHPNQRFREPFGLAPIEAMACGCPVIAWRFGAMPETVDDGQTGFLVSTMEELVRAIHTVKDDIFSMNGYMREKSREQAQKFSIQRMADRVEELATEAVDTGGW